MSIVKENVCSADQYFEDPQGNYHFDMKRIKDAHKYCKDKVTSKMKNEISKIFVANTFTKEWEMEDYFKLAKRYHYKVYTIIVENRHKSENIHGVPEEKLQMMKDRFNIKL